MSYGSELKARLKALKLSQSELAEKIGVSRQAVSLWVKEKTMPHRAIQGAVENVLRQKENAVIESVKEHRFVKGCPLCGAELTSSSWTVRNGICVSFRAYCQECEATFLIDKKDDRDIFSIWNRRSDGDS